MADVVKDRNPLQNLAPPKTAEPDPALEMKPLDESHLFGSPKNKKKAVKIDIKEPEETTLPVEAPLPVKPKKPRKKRVLSEAHKKALAAGRAKGLETRRRRAAERKAKAKQLAGIKDQEFIEKQARKANTEHKRTIALANQYKAQAQQVKKAEFQPAFKQEKQNTVNDPDAEFKKFYQMMSKYEKMRELKRQEQEKNQQPPRPSYQNLGNYGHPRLQRRGPARRANINRQSIGFGHSNNRRRALSKQPNNNNYLGFFS